MISEATRERQAVEYSGHLYVPSDLGVSHRIEVNLSRVLMSLMMQRHSAPVLATVALLRPRRLIQS